MTSNQPNSNEPRWPEFRKWLRQQVNASGKSQSQIAEEIGVTQPMVSAWVRGAKRPSTANCDKLANALILDIDEVLVQAGHRPRIVTDDEPELRAIVEKLRRIPKSDYEGIELFIDFVYERAKKRR